MMSAIRRFAKLMGITVQSRMYYRATFLLNLVTPLLLLGGQFLLWDSLYGLQAGGSLGGYARADMFAYLLLAFSINSLLTWSSENMLSREIRSGLVIARRLRPVSFLSQSLADMCGNMILQGIVNFAVAGTAFAVFSPYVTLPRADMLPLFLLSLCLAMALRMMLVSCFSLLCFYTTGYLGLTWTRTALTEFFSGALVPVALFPAWLRAISYVSPFPLMLQVPVAILLGQPLPMPVWLTMSLQALWIAVFFALHTLLYHHIRQNATLAGG